MRVLVFGAAGRIGRQVVERALGRGHSVTAFLHDSVLDVEHSSLRSVNGDVREYDSVARAMASASAVAFALSQSSGGAHIHETGIANVIHAMAAHGVGPLAAVSAAGAFDRTSRELSLGYRALIATTLRSAYDDLEAMETRIRASDLDWTIVRPAGLSDEPASGSYRVSLNGGLLSKAGRISRADVAAFLLKALETDTYRRRTVVIAQ